MELSAISAVNSGSVNCLLSKGANRTFRGCCVRGLKASFLGDEDPKKKKHESNQRAVSRGLTQDLASFWQRAGERRGGSHEGDTTRGRDARGR